MTFRPDTKHLERAFMEAAGLTVDAPASDPALWAEPQGGAMLTVRQTNDLVKAVRDAAPADPELAHGAEDGLHYAVLKAIADNQCEDPQMCAYVATTTQEIQFPRWKA